MINWFKKIILSTLLVFFGYKTCAQNTIILTPYNYKTWVPTSQACSGCGSFFVMVVNNPTPSNGYYYYDIYLWSNSFYQNGYAANSYVKNIQISLLLPSGLYKGVLNVDYALVPPKSAYFDGYFHLAYVYSLSPQQTIKLNWFSTTPW